MHSIKRKIGRFSGPYFPGFGPSWMFKVEKVVWKSHLLFVIFSVILGVSSHTEERYWLAVLTEASFWSSLHLVSKGQELGTVKEGGWNKVRHRQSSLSIWRESQNCPSTKIYPDTHTRKPDLTWLTYTHIQTHAFRCLLSTLSSLYFYPSFGLSASLSLTLL